MAAPIGHAALKGSEVPQHATFAHSKEDVLNALSFYFGQPVSPEKLKDYSEHHAATCTLPLLSRSSPAPLPLPFFTTPTIATRGCAQTTFRMRTRARTQRSVTRSTT